MADEKPSFPSDETLTVTLLSSEWKSSKGGLSTVSRELAIQLAKHLNVEVYVYLPKCSEEDKKVAGSHGVQLIEAEELPGFEPINWLTSLPKGHLPHCLIGHGLHLGRQIPLIKRHHDCKWVQVVHTAPEELGMYKSYEEAIFRGEQKHQAEVKLCELADQVVAVGSKLADVYSRSLRPSRKDQDVINLTPSIFTEFLSVQQATEERSTFCVLVFGRGDGEDFKLKGYDIAVQAVDELKDSSYHLMFVGAPGGKEDEVTKKLVQHGILPSQLTVRHFKESREELAKLFCEVDLAIMPSRTEGFGLTALEALSAGLPVLVSANSGLGDALKKVPSGFSHVVDSEDPKEWAKAINIVRQKGREVRLEEANLLREKYALKYSWQKQCDYLVEKMLHLSFGNIQEKLEREQNQVENANEEMDNLEKLKETSQEAGNIQDKLEREQNQVENANEKMDNLEKLKETSQEAEANVMQQPSGAVPAGRVTGEVSGATASTHDNEDSTGEGGTLKREHSDPDLERKPNVMQHPSGAAPAGRVSGEVSGATSSPHDSGDPTGEGSALKRKHSDPDPERSVKLKIDVEAMEHSTQDRTPVSTGASVLPVSSEQNQSSSVNAEAPQAQRNIPTPQQVLCSFADHYMRTTLPKSREDYDYLKNLLEGIGASFADNSEV